jgi:hypothetical protein
VKLLKKTKKVPCGVELRLSDYIDLNEGRTLYDEEDWYYEEYLSDVKVYVSGKLVDPTKVVLKFEENNNG